MQLINLKLYKLADNIHIEGTVSQIFYLGPCYNFMSKNGKILVILKNKFSTFDKTKTRTYIKNLRHGSLHMTPIYVCFKFCFFK